MCGMPQPPSPAILVVDTRPIAVYAPNAQCREGVATVQSKKTLFRNASRTGRVSTASAALAAVLSILAAGAPCSAQVQSKAQAQCLTAMNDSAAKVAKAQIGAAQKCLKAAASGRLEPGQTGAAVPQRRQRGEGRPGRHGDIREGRVRLQGASPRFRARRGCDGELGRRRGGARHVRRSLRCEPRCGGHRCQDEQSRREVSGQRHEGDGQAARGHARRVPRLQEGGSQEPIDHVDRRARALPRCDRHRCAPQGRARPHEAQLDADRDLRDHAAGHRVSGRLRRRSRSHRVPGGGVALPRLRHLRPGRRARRGLRPLRRRARQRELRRAGTHADAHATAFDGAHADPHDGPLGGARDDDPGRSSAPLVRSRASRSRPARGSSPIHSPRRRTKTAPPATRTSRSTVCSATTRPARARRPSTGRCRGSATSTTRAASRATPAGGAASSSSSSTTGATRISRRRSATRT